MARMDGLVTSTHTHARLLASSSSSSFSPHNPTPTHPHPHPQVLLERGVASGKLEQMVRFCAPGALIEFLRPGEEFWGPRRTFR